MTDWSDPVARLRLMTQAGAEEYNRRLAAHHAAATVATVNGYAIRPVASRFGQLFLVVGANAAFATQAEAEQHARGLTPGQTREDTP